MAQAPRDQNRITTLLATSNADGTTPVVLWADPATHRLLVDASGAGMGTVTSVSVVSANGFAGTVATATTTPAITLSTTITGILKGNGTAISAAVSNTDYQAPITLTTTGTSGVATFNGTTLNIPNYAVSGSGLTVGTTTITSGTTTRVLFDNAGVLGEYVISGTGNVAMTTSPTFVTPTLGAATATTINGNTFTTGTYTLTGQAGKTLTFNGSITLTGTDAQTYTFPTTTATIARTDTGQTFTGVQNFTSPDTTTSITTSTVSFTAWAGATTLLTIGGTGASASMFAPSTLDAASSITGAIRTSGGISAAKALNIGTTITGGGAFSIGTSNSATVGTIELGAATDTTLARVSAGVISVEGVTIPSISSTNTLTNKRITRRFIATTQSATPTINSDNTDVASITALAQAITSMTTNLSGTPSAGDFLEVQITDNGTARAITWGTSFAATTVALPTTTVISTLLRVLFEWDTVSAKWGCVAVA